MAGNILRYLGGEIEAGESEEEALRREVREEAGCEIEIMKELGEHEFQDTKKNYSILNMERYKLELF